MNSNSRRQGRGAHTPARGPCLLRPAPKASPRHSQWFCLHPPLYPASSQRDPERNNMLRVVNFFTFNYGSISKSIPLLILMDLLYFSYDFCWFLLGMGNGKCALASIWVRLFFLFLVGMDSGQA